MNIRNLFNSLVDFLLGKSGESTKGYNFLIVCTGNTCRSPMAKAILCNIRDTGMDYGLVKGVESAGLSIHDRQAACNAIEIGRDFGYDLTRHVPQSLTQELIDWADIVLTMDTDAAQRIRQNFDTVGKVKTLATFGNDSGPVADPYGGTIDMYHKTAQQMYRFIQKGLEIMAASEGK